MEQKRVIDDLIEIAEKLSCSAQSPPAPEACPHCKMVERLRKMKVEDETILKKAEADRQAGVVPTASKMQPLSEEEKQARLRQGMQAFEQQLGMPFQEGLTLFALAGWKRTASPEIQRIFDEWIVAIMTADEAAQVKCSDAYHAALRRGRSDEGNAG